MRKYIAYALGEFVLIVVGILVALQINNWNDLRNERIKMENQRIVFLNEVYKDLKEDVGLLDMLIERFSQQYLSSWHCYEILAGPEKIAFDTSEFYGHVRASMNAVITARNQNSWDEFAKTGQTFVFQDNDLVDQLHKYYLYYDDRVSAFNLNAQSARSELRKILTRSHDMTSLTIFHQETLAMEEFSPQFLNKVYSPAHFSHLLENPDALPIISHIITSSKIFQLHFGSIKAQAADILQILENRYLDILN